MNCFSVIRVISVGGLAVYNNIFSSKCYEILVSVYVTFRSTVKDNV